MTELLWGVAIPVAYTPPPPPRPVRMVPSYMYDPDYHRFYSAITDILRDDERRLDEAGALG